VHQGVGRQHNGSLGGVLGLDPKVKAVSVGPRRHMPNCGAGLRHDDIGAIEEPILKELDMFCNG